MNDIIKTQRINNLLDIYGKMLTSKQFDVASQYFSFDLSLSEIADNNNVSRAAVYDLLDRTIKLLENYESKLHVYENKESLAKIVATLDKKDQEKFKDIL